MTGVSAKEALKYAFSQEMLKIYGTLLLADISLIVGLSFSTNWAGVGGTSGLIGQVFGSLLLLAGFVIGVGGIVAFIYKVIADANSRKE